MRCYNQDNKVVSGDCTQEEVSSICTGCRLPILTLYAGSLLEVDGLEEYGVKCRVSRDFGRFSQVLEEKFPKKKLDGVLTGTRGACNLHSDNITYCGVMKRWLSVCGKESMLIEQWRNITSSMPFGIKFPETYVRGRSAQALYIYNLFFRENEK